MKTSVFYFLSLSLFSFLASAGTSGFAGGDSAARTFVDKKGRIYREVFICNAGEDADRCTRGWEFEYHNQEKKPFKIILPFSENPESGLVTGEGA